MESRPWLPYILYAKVTGICTLVLAIAAAIAFAGDIAGGIPGFVCLPIAITLGITLVVFRSSRYWVYYAGDR